jgi:hypothetical protein
MSAHANCTHPATKSARAACRRDTKNFPGTKLAAPTVDHGSYTFQDEMDAEMRRTAVYETEPVESAPALNHVITRSTWKGYRNFTVAIAVTVWGAQPDTEFQGKIVAWGEKRLSYVSATGTRNTIDTSRVKGVRALGV